MEFVVAMLLIFSAIFSVIHFELKERYRIVCKKDTYEVQRKWGYVTGDWDTYNCWNSDDYKRDGYDSEDEATNVLKSHLEKSKEIEIANKTRVVNKNPLREG